MSEFAANGLEHRFILQSIRACCRHAFGFASSLRFPCILALVFLLSAFPVSSSGSELTKREAEIRFAENVTAWLNEFSNRRRVTTLFLNRQSPFSGVQEQFVNTTTGNLTFLVRDLVWLDAMPIVMGRVYDSSGVAEADFGPGWKLTVQERLTSESAELMTWTDASGANWNLYRVGNWLHAKYPSLCPVRRGQVDGDQIILHTDDLERVFAAERGTGRDGYRLIEVRHKRDSAGKLRFEYDHHGRLVLVASAQGSVRLFRDAAGRVERMVDRTERETSYEYDQAGRLARHRDLGMNVWQYSYDRDGKLEFVVDPRGSAIVGVTYDSRGRVREARALRVERRFEYLIRRDAGHG